MTRFLALVAACSLVAGAASAEMHEGEAAAEVPAYQLDINFVCGSALDSQTAYADNLITWLQGRCQDGFIGADVCKEINHYVSAYSGQVKEQVAGCREMVESQE